MNKKGKNKKQKKDKDKKNESIINEEGNESNSEEERDRDEEENKSKDDSQKSRVSNHLAKKNSLKLNKIVLDNFKSFEGRHEVGYFLNFSVVLGPNGSGKSNIIDAICFALGMKTHTLRTKNLKDLIYRQEIDVSQNQKKSAFVELYFEKNGEEIILKRTIGIKGGSDFYFNNSKVSVDEYNKELEKLDIPSKAKYFVLVQGAIDSILSKKNDLIDTIEYLSGSHSHKEEYEHLRTEIQNLNNEISKLSNEMNSIREDKDKVKTQIDNESIYMELIAQLNNILERIFLYKLGDLDLAIKTNEEALEDNEKSLKTVQDDKKEIIEFIKNKELEVRKLENSMKNEEGGENFKENVEDYNNQLVQCLENIKLNEGAIFSKISMLNQYKMDKKKRDEKKAVLVTQTKRIEKEIDELKKKIDYEKPEGKLNKAQVEEYRQISNQMELQTFQLRKDQEKFQQKLLELKTERILLEKNLSKLENEKNTLEIDLKSYIEKVDKEEVSKRKIEEENIEIKNIIAKKDTEKLTLDTEVEKVEKLLQEKLSQLAYYESETLESAKRKKISELINKNSNVHGFLYELIIPLQKKLEMPIKVALLKYLGHLVVENSDTAKYCSDFLKSKEINADVLVLENIPEKAIDETVRMRLGNLGNLVIDLIDCKKKGLKNAVNFFLKDLVLCYNKDNVNTLKNKGFNSIILIDGTYYRKGTITGGTYKNLDQYSFNYKHSNPEELEKLRKETELLSKQLSILEDKNSDFKELIQLKTKMIEKENAIELSYKNLKNYQDMIIKIQTSITQKEEYISQISNSFKNIDSDKDELINQLEEIENKLTEHQRNIFADFMKKNNLKSLKDLESYSLIEIKRWSEELKISEEKLNKIKSDIEILESKDEQIEKMDKSLSECKEKKKIYENDKITLEKKYKEAVAEYEKFKESSNEEYKKISFIKDNVKSKQADLDKIDKRIRSLLKNKIEYEHKITNSIESKKSVIEETKINIENYLKEIENRDQNSPIVVSFNVDIDKYIIANETKLGKKNLILDYNDIESKTKILERTSDGIKVKIEALKNKFAVTMKELEKYVKVVSLNEAEANKLKDKEEELAKKKKNMSLQVKTLISELDERNKEFEKVKKERKSKFEAFFNKLVKKLTNTYKDLTTPVNSMNPGGQIYFYTTNEDEPYLGSVIFLPTPPGKRVTYDIDQLSGGEKTIAILSLVIAMQSICDTPFIILDEIDSYLDPEHEAILENLFKTHNKNFQIIIVTHKSNIFRSAHSLIGTYFNKQRYSSIPISVDMTKI